MPDWTDDSDEPRQPPIGFAQPRVSPLEHPAPAAEAGSGEPQSPDQQQAPLDFLAPGQPMPALDSVVQLGQPPRDPQQPFSPSHAQEQQQDAWEPTEPLGDYLHPAQPDQSRSAWVSATAPSRQQGAAPWFPPPVGPAAQPAYPAPAPQAAAPAVAPQAYPAPVPQAYPPAAVPQSYPPAPAPQAYPPAAARRGTPAGAWTAQDAAMPWGVAKVGRVLALVGLPLIGVLLAGTIIRPLSFMLLVMASILCRQAGIATRSIIRAGQIAFGVVIAVWLAGLFSQLTGLLDALPYDATSTVARLACLVMLVGCPALGLVEAARSSHPADPRTGLQ